MKRFLIVIPRDDGGIEVYPMKEWLRQHPDMVPQGLDATRSTSHQIRLGLKRSGWVEQDTETEIRFMPPNAIDQCDSIEEIFGNDVNEESDDQGQSFALEYQLRDFIAQNISTVKINGQSLNLFVDQAGRDGIEYPTAVGPIDILAQDSEGAFVVFELKRARTSDRAIGQLSRYMGWVSSTIGKGKPVRGVIVAKEITDNLRYAVTVIPNVRLFEYEVSFSLNAVQPILDIHGG